MNLPPNLPRPNEPPVIPPEQFDRVLELVTAVARILPVKSESKYLTVQEAAAYCRVAVQTIYNNRRYIARMPGVRKLLFTREALDAWLAKRPSARRNRNG
jgi:excisionase family DNA binding protein